MSSFFAVVHPSDAPVSEPACPADTWMIVGAARLDNREDMLRWANADAGTSDLQLIAQFIAKRGVEGVRDILGDFAFVFRDRTTRETIAARDAFGVKALFYRLGDDELAFSSRATALA